jgi:hypothetical protein
MVCRPGIHGWMKKPVHGPLGKRGSVSTAFVSGIAMFEPLLKKGSTASFGALCPAMYTA